MSIHIMHDIVYIKHACIYTCIVWGECIAIQLKLVHAYSDNETSMHVYILYAIYKDVCICTNYTKYMTIECTIQVYTAAKSSMRHPFQLSNFH